MSAGSRSRLVAVADPDLERARKMRACMGFEDAMADYHDLLARPDIDVVSVCTPATSHAGIVLDAIRASKHVLCEKPITTTKEDAQAIASAASEQPDLCISCVFQHRDDPALQRARWLLEQQALGRVLAVHLSARARRDAAYYTDTRGRMETDGGGALMVQGIHLLDALIWLVGPVESVSATMDTFVHAIGTEDMIGGWARLVTGAVATIDCTTCAQRDVYTIDVLGETAALHLGYRPGWARTWSLRVKSRRRQSGWNMRWKAERRFPPESRFRAGSVATLAAGRLTGNDRIAPHLGHGPHVRRFLEAIEIGGAPPVSPADAARTLEAVLAFYQSANQGGAIRILSSQT
jgi:UDP-N-acetyl-2-amino-2-deoxyglucuronate dehydrogenase